MSYRSAAHHVHIIQLPAVRQLLGHAAGHVVEGVLAPAAVFYAVLAVVGLRPALLAALAWSYLALTVRAVTRNRLPGLLLLGAVLFTIRTFIAFATDSAFVYFLQPSIGNFCVAALFLASVPARQPLARRLADDFCVLPTSLAGHAPLHRFFGRISLLWAMVFLANGASGVLLLLHQSVGGFLALRPLTSAGLVVAGIAVSYLWFRRSLSGAGIRLSWSG